RRADPLVDLLVRENEPKPYIEALLLCHPSKCKFKICVTLGHVASLHQKTRCVSQVSCWPLVPTPVTPSGYPFRWQDRAADTRPALFSGFRRSAADPRSRAARVPVVRAGGRQHQADGRLEQVLGEAGPAAQPWLTGRLGVTPGGQRADHELDQQVAGGRRLGHLTERDRLHAALREQPFGGDDDLLGRGPPVRSRSPAGPGHHALSTSPGQIHAPPYWRSN